MVDMVEIYCPYCGEFNDVDVDAGSQGEMVQDCEVCCRPMQLTVTRDEWGDPDVAVEREE